MKVKRPKPTRERAAPAARKPAAKRRAKTGKTPAEFVSSYDVEELEPAPRERFTVMRVVVPVSMKAFVYTQKDKMGLDTPSEYVRRVLKDLKEAHEEFEYEKNGFGAYDDEPGRRSKRRR